MPISITRGGAGQLEAGSNVEVVEQHTRFLSTSHVYRLHDASKLFSESFVALTFFLNIVATRSSLEHGWKQSYPWCAVKHISVASHLFPVLHQFLRY